MTRGKAGGPAPTMTGPRSGPETTRRRSASILAHRRPIDLILARLEDVRETASGWVARCPAHADDTPSLSLAESPSGAVLLHCFAGCPTTAVLTALGLEWRDLFPHDTAPGRSRRIQRRRGPSEAELWTRFKGLRRSLRVELATLIRDTEAAARRAGPALFDDDGLAGRVRQLGRWEWLFERLLGEGSPDEQLEALVLAAEEVRRYGWQG